MSEDQFQRQIEFIVEQQAKFSAGIARLEENLSEHVRQTGTNFAKVGDMILSLANHSQVQDEQIAALIESNRETDRRLSETDRRLRETDERLNILIKVVERFFGGNGEKARE